MRAVILDPPVLPAKTYQTKYNAQFYEQLRKDLTAAVDQGKGVEITLDDTDPVVSIKALYKKVARQENLDISFSTLSSRTRTLRTGRTIQESHVLFAYVRKKASV